MAKSKNENLITGKTQSGIQFSINKKIKEDARLLYLLSKIQNNNLEPMERNSALFNLFELIFGSGEGVNAFLNEVAAKHDGVADITSLMTELNDMFDALALKNSSASQS